MGKKKKFRSIADEWDDIIRENQSSDYYIPLPSEYQNTVSDEDEYNPFGTDYDTLTDIVTENVTIEPPKDPEKILEKIIKPAEAIKETVVEKIEDWFPVWYKDMPKLDLPKPDTERFNNIDYYSFIQFFARKCIEKLDGNPNINTLYGVTKESFDDILTSTTSDTAEVKSRRIIYLNILKMISYLGRTIRVISASPYAIYMAEEFNSRFSHISKIDKELFNFIGICDNNGECKYVYATKVFGGDFDIDSMMKSFDTSCASDPQNGIEYIHKGLDDFFKFESIINSVVSSGIYYRPNFSDFCDESGIYYNDNNNAKDEISKTVDTDANTEFKVNTGRGSAESIDYMNYQIIDISSLENQVNMVELIILNYFGELANIGNDIEEIDEGIFEDEKEVIKETPKASPMDFAKRYHQDDEINELVKHDLEVVGEDDIEIVDEEDIDLDTLTIKPVHRKR